MSWLLSRPKLRTRIRGLFKKRLPPEPFLPDGIRVYCIGDIHGRNDLLHRLLSDIMDDMKAFVGQVIIVCLGDFIDRGGDSREVVETLLRHERLGIEFIYLRGNHEQMLLDCLQNPALISSWLPYGGLPTLASYDVAVRKLPTKKQDLVDIQQRLKENLPASHQRFFLETQLSYTLGSYFFVHAGIYPRRSLNKQQPEDLLWIRDEFVRSTKNHGKIIVHGHTITEQPQILNNRIGIDTGAYSSGKLTCLALESGCQRILQTE